MKEYKADVIRVIKMTLEEMNFSSNIEMISVPLNLLRPELSALIRIGKKEGKLTLDSIASFLSCDEITNPKPATTVEEIKAMCKKLDIDIVADEAPSKTVPREASQKGISKAALYLQGKEEYREEAAEEVWNFYWGGRNKEGEQHSTKDTAKHLGISSWTLSRLMKEFGISKRSVSEAQKLKYEQARRAKQQVREAEQPQTPLKPEKKERKKSQKVSPEEWKRRAKQVNELYWDQGLKVEETAKKLGISQSTLNYWMNKCGIRRHSPAEKRELALKKKAGDALQGQ